MATALGARVRSPPRLGRVDCVRARTLSTFLECIRIAVEQSLEASEGGTM